MIVSRSKAEELLGKKLETLGKGRRSYYVLSEDGSRNLGGPYTKEGAEKRLGQVEFFKNRTSNPPDAVKDPRLWAKATAKVKSSVDVWPSAYASGQVVQAYKRMGGRYHNPGEAPDAEENPKRKKLISSRMKLRSRSQKEQLKSESSCLRAGAGAWMPCRRMSKGLARAFFVLGILPRGRGSTHIRSRLFLTATDTIM